MKVDWADANAPLADVLAQYLEVTAGSRNTANCAKWDHTIPWERDNWRALPRHEFNIVVDPDRPFMAKLVGFSLQDYYRDPEIHLHAWLRCNLARHALFDDDSCYAAVYRPWWGIVLEASLFEAPVVFRSDREPVVASQPLLQDTAALDDLEPPDFFRSGLMPLVHREYDYATQVAPQRLKVVFPTWARGPLSTAMSLRGMDNLLVDMLERPWFVHRLMRFVTDCRRTWLEARSKFLGQPISPGLLFNDEIGAPLLSPALYREFVLPYELDLAEFHGGIAYWHSCGNATAFLPDVATLPGLRLFHVGPHTDLATAARHMRPDVALEICIQDVRDVYDASEGQMQVSLERVVELCGGRAYTVRADGFDVVTTLEHDLARIQTWCRIAARVRGGDTQHTCQR